MPSSRHSAGLVIGRDAAVDRHDQLHALLFERVDGDGVQPVALFKAGRDIAGHMAALAAQILRQQAGRRNAVDVVIAEDGDMLAPGKRLFDAGGSLVHIQKGKRRPRADSCRIKIRGPRPHPDSRGCTAARP